MKKAVAVPYIIVLILGVAVIGLVGYWFASSGGKFSGQSAKTICENKFLQYCITKNEDMLYSDFQKDVQDCQAVSSSYTKCSEITGVSGVSGGRPPAQQQPEPQPPQECIQNNQQCNIPSPPNPRCCNIPEFSCKLEQARQILKCLP